jgi:spore coat protein U-like protein
MFKKAFIAGAVALAAIGSAHAGTGGGTLDVTLAVTTGCDINGAGGIGAGTGTAGKIDFGSYAPSATVAGAATPTSGAGALVVTCSGTQTPSLAFDGGVNPQAGVRQLKAVNAAAATQLIPYTLGSSVAATEYSVNTAVGQAPFTAGLARTITVHGAVVGAVPVGADGTYVDTVQVALTW